jgi:hypothetical protein
MTQLDRARLPWSPLKRSECYPTAPRNEPPTLEGILAEARSAFVHPSLRKVLHLPSVTLDFDAMQMIVQ